MKIVYVIDSLASKGGAERIISEKMNYMADLLGYDVTVVTCYQFPESMPNAYQISDNIRQINLQIEAHHQYRYHYPKRLWVKWKYFRELRHRLRETIKNINPDILIGVGYTLADVVCQSNYQAAIIIESHEAKMFTMSNELHQERLLLLKFFVKIYKYFYIKTIEQKATVVVTLTEQDAQEWRKAKRVEIIPNFSSMPISNISTGKNKKVIAVGRLEWQKGYDRLLSIWAETSRSHPDWQLNIYGEGSLKKELANQISQNELVNVHIHDFTTNISCQYAESSICVLTSRFEGFSLVLLEALRHGVPCITFDCPFGPAEVVGNEKCGYVVENGNLRLFASKLSYLMDNPNTRKTFSLNAIEKAKTYDKENIMRQWQRLFENLILHKQKNLNYETNLLSH